jgi:threonine/homoserine/homoserine lactone efflux protein
MGDLIPKLILTGLAASISPVAVMILITVLSRKNAKRNSLLWLLGFTLTLFALGFAGVYLLSAGGSGGTSDIDAYIDIALGALCLLAIPFDLLRGKKSGEPKVEGEMSVKRAFSLGCISMLINSSTFIIFISGLHEISRSNLVVLEEIISLAILTVFTLTTVLIPIAIYFVFPSRSERALAALEGWLTKHKKLIGTATLLVFGAYLVIKGLTAVV